MRPRPQSPKTFKEARTLGETHGLDVLADFARENPNPNSPAQEALDFLRRSAAQDEFLKSMRTPKIPEPGPPRLGDYRRSKYDRFRVYCSRCHYENVIRIADIKPHHDWKPMKDLQFGHKSCPATGAGMIRVTPLFPGKD